MGRTGRSRNVTRLDVFLHAVGPTGVSRNAVAICARMAASGWSVRLLCCRVVQGFEAPAGVSVHVLPGGGLPRVAGLARATGPLKRALRADPPEVFLSAGNHAHLASLVATRGLPLRTAFRISNDVDHGVRAIQRATSRAVVRRAGLVVLVSSALADSPVFAPLVATGRARVVRNGVDVARVRAGAAAPCPHPWLEDGAGPVVLAVARYSPQKNLGTLIEAVARVRETMPARLIVLGGGPEPARRDLIARAKRLGMADAIALPGPVANPFSWLARADVFALPSYWEGSSNALLEAMACGVPVLASRTAGDAHDVLGGGAYGVLIDPADSADFAAGLHRQLSVERVPVGERAEAFSLSATMDAYERALTALAAGPL